MANQLKHYGVLGMRWGKRRAAGNVSSVSVGRGPIGRAKEVAGLAVDATRHDLSKLKSAGSKIVNSKAFKTLVYDKDDVTGLIFKKSEVDKVKNFLSNKKQALSESFNRWQVKSLDRDIALNKQIIKELSEAKSLSLMEKRLISDLEADVKWMEDDLNTTFTKEEQDKYRNS